jgi:SPP1 gp7 family putative phage head morphogenesis protein
MAGQREAQIYRAVAKYRTELQDRSFTPANQQMQQAYLAAIQALEGQITAVTQRIADARANGTPTKPVWLYQEARYRQLIEGAQSEFARFAVRAGLAIGQGQMSAVQTSIDNAEKLLALALGQPPADIRPEVLIKPPTERLTDLSGFLSDGSPLSTLLDKLGPQAARDIGRALTTGLVLGRNPNEIARDMRRSAALTRYRAESIARTEIHRAAREATRRRFEDNSDVVAGWIWHSAHNRSTCPACWAMHGTFHKVDERLAGHVRCRCAMIPQTKTWEELGLGEGLEDTRVTVPLGSDLFAQLSDAEKAAILGPSKFAMYKSGDFVLSDFAHLDKNKRWGDSWREASIAQAIAAAEARRAAELKKPRKQREKAPKAPPGQTAADPTPGTMSARQVREAILDDWNSRAARMDEYRARIAEASDAITKFYAEEVQPLADAHYEALRDHGPGSPEERAAIKALEAKEAENEKLWARQKAIQKERDRFDYDFDEYVMEKYVYQKPSKAQIKYEVRPRGENGEQWKRGVESWRRLWGPNTETGTQTVYLRYTDDKKWPDLAKRAYQWQDGVHMPAKVRHAGYGRERSTYGTMIHELTHWLEHNDAFIRREVEKYYNARTAGEQLEKLKDVVPGSGYADNEVTRRDKFIEPYMGKDYGGQVGSHETLTMAIQMLFGSPVTLAREDPDMFEWVFNLTRRIGRP